MLIKSNHFQNIAFPSLTGTEEAAAIYIDETAMNVSLHTNAFTHCSASVGGAVSFKNGFVNFSDNQYGNNEAHIYGPDKAAFPVSLERRDYNALPQIYKDQFSRVLSERKMLSLNEIRSGGTVDGFYVVLLDQYGDVVTSSNGNILTLSM